MKKASLVHAKAHLSELVDLAEHRGETILISRHGRPAAALVPVALAVGGRPRRRRQLTEEEIDSLLAPVTGRGADAVAALSSGRSRLEAPSRRTR